MASCYADVALYKCIQKTTRTHLEFFYAKGNVKKKLIIIFRIDIVFKTVKTLIGEKHFSFA